MLGWTARGRDLATGTSTVLPTGDWLAVALPSGALGPLGLAATDLVAVGFAAAGWEGGVEKLRANWSPKGVPLQPASSRAQADKPRLVATGPRRARHLLRPTAAISGRPP